jgi:pheromone shutdown-related protein TraB
MNYKNLILLGTSHIAKQSLDDVTRIIEEKKPEIIALELDKSRLHALLHKKEQKIRLADIKAIGLKGFIFSLIGAFVEKKLGEFVGVAPGSEMITAVMLAKKNQSKIALIDQDIEITLKRFSKTLTWKEKFRFIIDIIKGLFVRDKELMFDLRKVPEKKIIEKLVNKVKKRYPNIYNVLIKERNAVMAHNLTRLMEENPDKLILGIIGAGHEEEIIELIKKGHKIEYSFSYSI